MTKESPISDAQFAAILQLQEAVVQIHRDIAAVRQDLGETRGEINAVNTRADRLEAQNDRLQEESKQHDKQITVMKFRMRIMAGLIVLLFALVAGMSWDGIAQFILRLF